MIFTRDNLVKLAQSIAVLIAFVAALEVLLRMAGIAYPPRTVTDPVLGMLYRPGVNFVFREEGYANVQINQEGFRDVDWPVDKPADEIRIAVLGDSFMEATQVPVEERVTEQMADLLSRERIFGDKKVRVMNFGMAGFGTGQEYLVLRERVAKYRPDLVVLAFLSGNDFTDNCQALRPHSQRPFFDVRNGQLVLDDSFARRHSWKDDIRRDLATESRIMQVTYEAKRTLRDLRGWAPEPAPKQGAPQQLDLNEYIYFPPPTAAWVQAWQITETLLLAINDESRHIGAKLLVAILPNDDQMHPDPAVRQQFADRLQLESIEYPNQQILSFCRDQKIAALDLLPPMRAYGEEHGVFLHGFENGALGRGHWNAAGHRLGAELITAKIREMQASLSESPSDGTNGQ